MIPLAWIAVVGVSSAVVYGVKKVYSMNCRSSTQLITRHTENEQEIARRQRKRELIEGRMVDMVKEIQQNFSIPVYSVSEFQAESLQRFINFNITDPAVAKLALSQLIGHCVQLQLATLQLEATDKAHKELEILELLVARL